MTENTGTTQKPCPEWEEPFLVELEKRGSVFHACKAVKAGRTWVYRHRKECESLRNRWDQAVEVATDELEDSAWQRAVDGWEEPVFFKGEQCGTVRKFSNSLVIFLLKTRRPEKFNIAMGDTGSEGSTIDRAAEFRAAVSQMKQSVPLAPSAA